MPSPDARLATVRENGAVTATPNRKALELFAPIAPNYERWAGVLSLGQDPRWRASMVAGLELPPQARVLDVAAGTGAITRLLEARGARVVAFDQSIEMLAMARGRGATVVRGTAERLPFPDASFDGVTFGYLLRYVEPAFAMRELVRVLRPGGEIGMVEFGRPKGVWGPLWWLYTRLLLPTAGATLGPGWREVGSFLGPSIDAFHRQFPHDRLAEVWRSAGLTEVRVARRSLGGGLIMWARKA
jgi:demethylmenaquinone methyltransferase/2-methoxy-6-polyprenyl-1,4-benzoquinol methylase